MKCEKCGAEIPAGYVYCAACGSEVQLVPDYNLLDDDILSNIVQHEAGGANDGNSAKTEKRVGKKGGKYSKNAVIWGAICVVIAAAVVTFFFMCQHIQKQQQNSYAYQYQKAEECFETQEWEDAAAHYQRALELKPKDKKAAGRLLDLYAATGDDDAAIAMLKKLIAADKGDRESVEKLVALYDKSGDYDAIIALYWEMQDSGLQEVFAAYLADPPAFNKVSGTYSEALRIEISADSRHDIFYTTDGSDPVQHGMPYEGGISLAKEGTTVLLAVARNERGFYSEAAEASYTIRYLPPEMPKAMPAGGTYADPQMITIQIPENCTAYYTWDGSDPTEGSAVYTEPLEMPPGNQVLSVVAVNSSGLKSGIYRVNYIYMP